MSLMGAAVGTLGLTVAYAQSNQSNLFRAWPTKRSIGDVCVRFLGYNASVGLSAIVGSVVAAGLNSTALGALIAGLGTI